MIPNPIIIRAYALRGLRLWLGTRIVVSILFVLSGSNPWRLSPIAIFNLILLSVAVCFIATARNRERALLGNLAVSPWTLTVMFAVTSIICEAMLNAAVRVIA